mgnify:CR=1 FL=1
MELTDFDRQHLINELNRCRDEIAREHHKIKYANKTVSNAKDIDDMTMPKWNISLSNIKIDLHDNSIKRIEKRLVGNK